MIVIVGIRVESTLSIRVNLKLAQLFAVEMLYLSEVSNHGFLESRPYEIATKAEKIDAIASFLERTTLQYLMLRVESLQDKSHKLAR